jgi:hypothetical protein
MEHTPSDEIEEVTAMVQAAIDRVGDGIKEGTVSVTYDGQPYWVAGEIWVRADCEVCGAHTVMRTPGYEAHLRMLAQTVMTAFCDQSKHEAQP